MRQNYEHSLLEGLNSLNDLRKVVGWDKQLFIDQAIHHFNKLYNTFSDRRVRGLEKYDSVLALITKHFFEDLKKEFMGLEDIKTFYILKKTEIIDTEYWDKVFSAFDDIVSALRMFPFTGHIQLIVDKNGLKFKGRMKNITVDSDLRKNSYELTRKFLAREVFLTYKLHSVDSSEGPEFELNFDFSNDNSKVYHIDLTDQYGFYLAFTNTFSNYLCTLGDLEKIPSHMCVEITNKLSIKKHKSSDLKELFQEADDKTILHFPFLFRPLSMIIPGRGSITSRVNFYEDFFASGSEKIYCHGCDDDPAKKNIGYFLNLFSIINS